MRPVGVLETNLVEVRAERNLGAGKIWGRSGFVGKEDGVGCKD